jgi:hypothetical protein
MVSIPNMGIFKTSGVYAVCKKHNCLLMMMMLSYGVMGENGRELPNIIIAWDK